MAVSGGIFDGLLVLDLSRVLAGPACTQMLADFGARVIKIEDPQGDEVRSWFPRDGEVSSTYQSVNRGKESLTLNLKSPEARAVLDALVKKADVLMHSFLEPVAERLGVDYARIHAANPTQAPCPERRALPRAPRPAPSAAPRLRRGCRTSYAYLPRDVQPLAAGMPRITSPAT